MKVSNTCGGWYSGGQLVGALVSKPLVKFAKLTGEDGALSCHNDTAYHKAVACKVAEFLARAPINSSNDVRSLVDGGRDKQVAENRQKLRPIVDTIFICARQNMALRGHRDSGRLLLEEPLDNDGNFRTLLRMRARAGEADLKDHLENGPTNAQYISPQIQNELLDAACKLVKSSVIADVIKSKFWCLLADAGHILRKI